MFFIVKSFYLESWKLFSFLRYLDFCPDYFGHLIKQLTLISKFMTSQTEKQIITIHILPNISRSKGNQTIKFHQFIEYNKRTF